MTESGLTYRDAGVDIDAGDELVERIKPVVKRTMRKEVLAGIGGFGALVEVPLDRPGRSSPSRATRSSRGSSSSRAPANTQIND